MRVWLPALLCAWCLLAQNRPVTIEAAVMPIVIALGKFQGGITAPTPSGI